jgi:hypothetical protein
MKTSLYRRIAAGTLLTLALGLHAQSVQLASPDTERNALSRMAGQTIRAANDEPISTVADYLIEPRSGDLRYLIVPSGRGAGGETYRLVPVAALDPAASNAQSVKLRIDRARWDQVGTLTQDWLREQVSIDTAHRQRLAQQFGVTSPLPGEGTTVELIRASSLKGRAIQAGNETLGTVSDVIIDLPNGVAWALVSAAGNMPNAGRNYLFPFDRTQISAGRGPITTSLSRNDFAGTQAMPTPTGFPSGGQNMNGVVSSIQQAVQGIPGMAPGSVQAVSEGRIVLRGTVTSEQQKAEVLRVASQAAPGVRVDNELVVRAPWMPLPFR